MPYRVPAMVYQQKLEAERVHRHLQQLMEQLQRGRDSLADQRQLLRRNVQRAKLVRGRIVRL